jgi:predicted regulator of Ras-like GTPase activity (Roadblock/LC7/MglB family)
VSSTDSLERFAWLIDDFVARVPGVAHAVVISADGLLLARSRHLPDERADQLAAVAAGLVSLADGAARCFDAGNVVQTIVEMQQGLVLTMSIRDGSCLVTLANATCDRGLVGYEMTLMGARVGKALIPEVRRELRTAQTT